MLIYDAQGMQLAAAKTRLEAEGAMRIAQIKKDDVGIETAKVSLEIAGREAVIADKKLQSATENLTQQEELGSNAKKAQEATQGMAISQLKAADSARRQSDSLEKIEALVGKPKPSTSAGETGGKNSDKPVMPKFKNMNEYLNYQLFGQLPGETPEETYTRKQFGTLKGESVQDAQMRQQYNIWKPKVETDQFHSGQPESPPQPSNTNIGNNTNTNSSAGYDEALNRAQGNPPVSDFKSPEKIKIYANWFPSLKMGASDLQKEQKLGESIYDVYMRLKNQSVPKGDIYQAYMRQNAMKAPEIDKVEGAKVAAGFDPKEFADNLRKEVSSITDRMDKLAASITTLAARPSVLQVSSPTPVSDAADIYSTLSKNAVRNAGI